MAEKAKPPVDRVITVQLGPDQSPHQETSRKGRRAPRVHTRQPLTTRSLMIVRRVTQGVTVGISLVPGSLGSVMQGIGASK